MIRRTRTVDTVFVKSRKMTGRIQTRPWWLGGEGVKTTEKQIHCPRCSYHYFEFYSTYHDTREVQCGATKNSISHGKNMKISLATLLEGETTYVIYPILYFTDWLHKYPLETLNITYISIHMKYFVHTAGINSCSSNQLDRLYHFFRPIGLIVACGHVLLLFLLLLEYSLPRGIIRKAPSKSCQLSDLGNGRGET